MVMLGKLREVGMATRDDIYRKFGKTSEAAQLLETELGTLLLLIGATEADLFENPDPETATSIYRKVNRKTLGQLIKQVHGSSNSLDHLEEMLSRAVAVRNKLTHHFFRRHNFRINSNEGRALMLDDLEGMHRDLLEAYKAIMRLSGIDLDAISDAIDLERLPKGHVPI